MGYSSNKGMTSRLRFNLVKVHSPTERVEKIVLLLSGSGRRVSVPDGLPGGGAAVCVHPPGVHIAAYVRSHGVRSAFATNQISQSRCSYSSHAHVERENIKLECYYWYRPTMRALNYVVDVEVIHLWCQIIVTSCLRRLTLDPSAIYWTGLLCSGDRRHLRCRRTSRWR